MMNKQHILGAITLGICLLAVYLSHQEGAQNLNAFEQWKKDFNVVYEIEENNFRRLIFEENLAKIMKHNSDETQTYKEGINQFTGLTQAEFVANYLGSYAPQGLQAEEIQEVSWREDNADVDWTTKGGVSPVKNQGQCGSCWAFSTTGVLESWSMLNGNTVSLSEQQLVDCSRPQGNQGCNGGWPSSALNYVKANGITTESAYAYTAKDGQCKTQGGSFKISGYASASGCNGLANAIQSRPVSVTVDANNWSRYSSGAFNNCGTSIDHAVLLVGIVGGNWKIKNSWGPSWGEKGFIRLAGSGNTCGVCAYAGVMPQ